MEAFKPFLGIGLKNYAEYQVGCTFQNNIFMFSFVVIVVQSQVPVPQVVLLYVLSQVLSYLFVP